MKRIRLILLFAALLLCTTCSRLYDGGENCPHDIKALMDSAEVVMNDNPQKALDYMESIDARSLRSKAKQARYALLYTEAQYKNYNPIPSDSLISIIIGLFATFFLSKNLNILLLGEMYAENLGLNIRRNSVAIILVSGYLTAIVTAYCGPIAFVGLAIPHIARFLFRSSDHRLLIPATMLIGMDMTLFCNLIAGMPWFEMNLPINAVTAFIGAPVVISVIMKNKK